MTTPAEQVKELFGSSLPSFTAEMEQDQKEDRDQESLLDDRRQKWPKQAGKGRGHQLDKRPRDDGRSWNWSKSSDQKYDRLTDQVSGEEVRRLMALLTRLCLRQEDDLAATRADSAFLLYMETRPDMNTASGPYQPFTNHFFGIAQKWQKVKEETPTKLDLSLRSTLLLAYMTEFQERLRHALEPNNKETSVKAGWLQETPGAPPCWTYAKWDATKKESILDTSKPPATHSKKLFCLQTFLSLKLATGRRPCLTSQFERSSFRPLPFLKEGLDFMSHLFKFSERRDFPWHGILYLTCSVLQLRLETRVSKTFGL